MLEGAAAQLRAGELRDRQQQGCDAGTVGDPATSVDGDGGTADWGDEEDGAEELATYLRRPHSL